MVYSSTCRWIYSCSLFGNSWEMVMNPLTDKQTEALLSIRDYQEEHGYSPSYREMAIRLGKSKKAVYDTICAVQKKGYIHQVSGRPRSIRILKLPPGHQRCSGCQFCQDGAVCVHPSSVGRVSEIRMGLVIMASERKTAPAWCPL